MLVSNFFSAVRTANISCYISLMFFLIRSLLLFGFYPDTQFGVVLQCVLFNDAVGYVTPTKAGSVSMERWCSDTGKSNPEFSW